MTCHHRFHIASSTSSRMPGAALATALALVLGGIAPAAFADDSAAAFETPLDRIPTRFVTDGGTTIGVGALLQFDAHRFSGAASGDDRDLRRLGVGVYAERPDAYKFVAFYDVKYDVWVDAFVGVGNARTGHFRLGQFRTPVGMDAGNGSEAAFTFLEPSIAESAVDQGRRVGVDWTYAHGTDWRLNLGAFSGGDLGGHHDGDTVAGRFVLTPRQDDTGVVHLGLSASRERPRDRSARFASGNEVALAGPGTVDSGLLTDVARIDRLGVETAWGQGPWAVQGGWLRAKAARTAQTDVNLTGAYAQASWVVTGERKPYADGAFGSPGAGAGHGAFEVALRYSALRMDTGLGPSQRQRNWTLGANWSLGQRIRMQANYIRNLDVHGSGDRNLFALRTQVLF